MNFQVPFAILAFISFFKVLNWICFSWIFSGLNSAIRFSWIRGRPSVCCLDARSFPAFLLIFCKVLVFSLFHSVNILPRLNFRIFAFCNFVASISCCLFFIYSFFLLLLHGVRIFGTNLHRFENLVCDVSAIVSIDISLEGNYALFVGCILSLNEVALSVLSRICSVECPYFISVFFF